VANEDEDSDDEEEGMNAFSAVKVDEEVQKGKSTKAQLDLWDKLLESRIRLQKSVQTCNCLPQTEHLKKFKVAGGNSIVDLTSTTRASITDLTTKLLELQAALMKMNPQTKHILTGGQAKAEKPEDDDEEIPSDTEDEKSESDREDEGKEQEDKLKLPSRKGKHTLTMAEYEEEISKRHQAFGKYRDEQITKWYERTRLSTGKAFNKSSFSSFDRSALLQIKQVLSDKERLLKRTRLKRTPYRILGRREEEENETNGAASADTHLKDYDSNIFDDGDFYHELLKELIERKSNVDSDDPVAVGRQMLQLQKLRTKIKKKVDTRASKGRKVRYNVHNKLVNFTVPQQVQGISDQARNDLFSSLFGRNNSIPIANGAS